MPYDPQRGVVPNDGGRVSGEPGLYCAGWLATGPRGVIVDTMTSAFAVGQNMVDDIAAKDQEITSKEGYSRVERLFEERGVRPVSFEEWERIDEQEKTKGLSAGKPRSKFTDVKDMVDVLKS